MTDLLVRLLLEAAEEAVAATDEEFGERHPPYYRWESSMLSLQAAVEAVRASTGEGK